MWSGKLLFASKALCRGEHWVICSSAVSAEVPCHPSPRALHVALLIYGGKLVDLPSDYIIIHGTKHKAWYPTCSPYTATCFFPHSVLRVDVKRSMLIEVAWKTKPGFSLTSNDFFPTETGLMKVGMYLTVTQRLDILAEEMCFTTGCWSNFPLTQIPEQFV